MYQNNLFQNIAGYTNINLTIIDYEKVPFVCKTFRVMLMTEGMHMLKITISIITGITMAAGIQRSHR